MNILPLPSKAHLKQCFLYDKQTGALHWRNRPRSHFESQKEFLRWNRRFAGREALSHKMRAGHKRLTLDSQMYLAHRIIWKLVTGKDPKWLVDHEDRKGGNNAWKNLREANDSQSVINRKLFRNNTSGCVGVVYSKQHRRWRATLDIRKKRVELGLHKTFSAAVAARRAAETVYHGEFAPK